MFFPIVLSFFTAFITLFTTKAFVYDHHSLEREPQVNQLFVSAVQYPVKGGYSLEKFLEKLELHIRSVKQEGQKQEAPQLIVFPELVALDLLQTDTLDGQTAELKVIAKSMTPKIFEHISKLSKDLDISILAGSFPRYVDDSIRNTAILALPSGKSILQDKIFLTPFEKLWGWQPGNTIQVFQAPWGLTSIFICYDSEIPVLAHRLAETPLDLLLVPSMTESIDGFRRVRWTAQAHAIYHYSYVVHAGTVGSSPIVGENYGQASILTPSDREFQGLLKEGKANASAIIHSTLDFEKLRNLRATAGIHPSRDQRSRDLNQIKLVVEE